jgi:choline dehydrogenase
MREQAFDHVVVGAGAAGCVVAARLAEAGAGTVALVEAGGPDHSPWIRIPIGFARLMNDSRLNWGYATEPEPGLDGRRVPWPRGRVLGGSGSINGLVFLRGAPGDFDLWERLGAAGWGWKDVLPFFRRSETNLVPGLDPALHGQDGPIPVSPITRPSRVAAAFVEAAAAGGFRRNPDFNGAELEGAGFVTLNTRGGRRVTTAMAHLRPQLRRGAVALLLRQQAERITFDGRRATGVLLRSADGGETRLTARREVVLAAGAVNTPKLLMLSGLGPAASLGALGIPVVADLPGVGCNLQDHVLARLVFRCRERITLNDALRSPAGLARIGLEYLLRQGGPLAISAAEASLFARLPGLPPSTSAGAGPDVQFQVANFSLDSYASGLHRFPGFIVSATVCRPESRGAVRLRTPDPRAPPLIAANYLTEPYDRAVLVEGLRLGRRIAATPPLASLVETEHRPGREAATEEALLRHIRATAGTVFHPCGTCAMGDGPLAVLDPSLRVRGVGGLRVIDASAMPTIPSTNIHAATIMLAERGAALMAEAARG